MTNILLNVHENLMKWISINQLIYKKIKNQQSTMKKKNSLEKVKILKKIK